MTQPLSPRLKKNDLARTFKHDCDRQLRISLGPRRVVAQSGITPPEDPGPRPGIRLVQEAGHEWERQKFADLVRVFGDASGVCYRRPDPAGPFEETDLLAELRSPAPRSVIVEGGFAVPSSLSPALERLRAQYGLEVRAARPDIVWLRRYPTGAPLLGTIDPTALPEYELHIIDVKLAAEPSLRHFTEVTFYAIALAAALREAGLDGRYVVAAQGFVWPGTYDEGKFRSDVATAREAGLSAPEERALEAQLIAVPYEVYSVRVEQFLEERLPRVLDTPPEELAWFVVPMCQLCENLEHCQTQAEAEDNLCRVPWISRGQAELLATEGIRTVADLVEAIATDAPAWRQARQANIQLLADAPAVAARARALIEQQPVEVDGRRTALMPRFSNLTIYTSIHFDPGSGLTFALGVSVVYFPPRPRPAPGDAPPPPQRPEIEKHVLLVERREEQRERLRLLEYLRVVNRWLRRAADDGATAHFYFWDQLELRHLRRVIERHMIHPDVVEEIGLLLRLFPPDSELPEAEVFRSQPGTVVKDVLRTLVGLPLPYTYTALEAAASYFPPTLADGSTYGYRVPYGFFTDLSDQIPFERAYEMWEGKVFLRRPPGPDGQPGERYLHTELTDELRRTGDVHLQALEHVVRTVQQRFGNRLVLRKEPLQIGSARRANIPERSRQLLTFERLDAVVGELTNRRERALPIEEREARFISIRDLVLLDDATAAALLDQVRQENPRYAARDLLAFRFAPTSRDARIRTGEFLLVLWNADEPDLLDQPWRVAAGLSFEDALVQTDGVRWKAGLPVHRLLRVEVADLRAADTPPVVVLAPADPDLFTIAQGQGLIDLSRPLVLDPMYQDYRTERVERVLRAIGGAPPPRMRRRT